jgi:diguanylate cyclase (GGDEF)-like protein/PAS domain S-box-containing protein
VVEAFRQASLKGWDYAMQHPQHMVELIYNRYSQRKTREHLLFEAETMRELMRPDLVELGYMNPGRWQHIAHVYSQLDLLPQHAEIEGLLYQTPDLAYQKIKQQLFYSMLAMLLIGILAALFSWLFHLANQRKKRFEALFIHAPISLIEIDQQGTILNWNNQAKKTFKYSEHEAIGQNVFDLLVTDEAKEKIQALAAKTFEINSFTYSENQNLCKNGEKLVCHWTNMPIDLGSSQSKRILCMARDITQEKHMAQQLYRAAHYDALTGLPNRRLMLDLFKQAITQASKQQTVLAILFIDLNGFKAINDTHGHQIGDEVLKIVAKRIPQTLQPTDLFGRLSGDEFLVVIHLLADKTAIPQIERIRNSLEQPMHTNNLTLQISASIGLSLYPQDAQDIEQFVRIADQSMYKVKAQHKAQRTE